MCFTRHSDWSFSHQQHWANPFREIIDGENECGLQLICYLTMNSRDRLDNNISFMFNASNISLHVIMKARITITTFDKGKNEAKGKRKTKKWNLIRTWLVAWTWLGLELDSYNEQTRIQPAKCCCMLVLLFHVKRELFTLTYEDQSMRQEMQAIYLGEVYNIHKTRLSMTKLISSNIRKTKSSLGGSLD